MKKVKRKVKKKPAASLEKLRRTDPERSTENMRRGSNHGNAVLTEAKVRNIRKMLGRGSPYRKIAEKYGVSTRTIAMIRHRVTWNSPECFP